MFEDRKDAGQKLAQALETYRGSGALLLAIPRGGVEVGAEVSKALSLPLELLIVRKLPLPMNPESGFGAIAEDGSTYRHPFALRELSDETIAEIEEEQREEIRRRIGVLRQGRELPDIENRTVTLIDDGLAMGSTMRAGIHFCKNKRAGKIVVAVPVAGSRTKGEIGEMVDEIIALESPPNFRAVAQVYRNWYDVTDAEVIDIMKGLSA